MPLAKHKREETEQKKGDDEILQLGDVQVAQAGQREPGPVVGVVDDLAVGAALDKAALRAVITGHVQHGRGQLAHAADEHTIRGTLPMLDEMKDAELREKVIDAWALSDS